MKGPKASTGRRRGAVVRRVVETARQLFDQRGYAQTSVRELAAATGVSTQTLYNNIGGKPAVLGLVLGLADGHGQAQKLEREMALSPSSREVLSVAARLHRQMMEQAGDIVRVVYEAAHGDAEAAPVRDLLLRQQRERCASIARRLAALGGLRPGLDEDAVAVALYALLSHEAFVRLVGQSGWSPDRFETWLCELLGRELLVGAPAVRPMAIS